jgi:hypothetical protein
LRTPAFCGGAAWLSGLTAGTLFMTKKKKTDNYVFSLGFYYARE